MKSYNQVDTLWEIVAFRVWAYTREGQVRWGFMVTPNTLCRLLKAKTFVKRQTSHPPPRRAKRRIQVNKG